MTCNNTYDLTMPPSLLASLLVLLLLLSAT
jgi:hypothetical protein